MDTILIDNRTNEELARGTRHDMLAKLSFDPDNRDLVDVNTGRMLSWALPARR